MGPRPFGRGRVAPPYMLGKLHTASMGPRPFGRGRTPTVRNNATATPSFNGAATFRSRKAQAAPPGRYGLAELQWGRDLSVAEGPSWRPDPPTTCPASMGPRPFGRGRGIARLLAGEKAQLQWGRDLSVAEGGRGRRGRGGRQQASMGPRPFGRGRGRREMPVLQVPAALQWGRDLSVAEGWPTSPRPTTSTPQASMGPRPFGRGRPQATARRAPRSRLQWGRDLSVAEGRGDRRPRIGARRASMGPRPFGRGRGRARGRARGRVRGLQWGRDLSVAEGARSEAAAWKTIRFNGAATFRSRKDPRYRPVTRPDTMLQWGRDLSVAEGRYPSGMPSCAAIRFNGAATFRSRKGRVALA